MSPILLKVLMNLFSQMPTIAQDIEKAIKEAESSDDASAKVKAILGDLNKLIDTVSGML